MSKFLLLVFVICSFSLIIGSEKTVKTPQNIKFLTPKFNQTKNQCRSGCTIGPGYDASACSYYNAQDWLPNAYASAATCACALGNVAGRESPSAQCVRSYLRNVHDGQSEDTKRQLSAFKRQECNGWVCSPTYISWIHKNFVEWVYQVHVNAYQHCCCPGSVAPRFTWNGVMFNWNGILPCYAIVRMQQGFGPCKCQSW
jgi:hypothetical protein